MEVLVKSLKTLELNRKAELMGDEGVKFFWCRSCVTTEKPLSRPLIERSLSGRSTIFQTGLGWGRQLLSLKQKPIIFAESCMKMKEIEPREGRVPRAHFSPPPTPPEAPMD